MRINQYGAQNLRSMIFTLLCFAFMMYFLISKADEHPKPAPPEISIPNISKEKTTIICVDCDQPFEFPGHEQANEAMPNNPFIGELRKAMYWQDIYHQFESKAHYDNCDFEDANAYIDELLQEVGKYASEATNSSKLADDAATNTLIKKAFFALGQALHATQDFYAHSNYVELKSKSIKRVDEIPLVRPWTDEGKKIIVSMQKDNLVSGFVFWGLPQKCQSGALSHKQLAKDTDDTFSGKVKIPSLENLTQYKIALYLARETSKDLIIHAFRTWPILKKFNGPNVAFDNLIDRRGI